MRLEREREGGEPAERQSRRRSRANSKRAEESERALLSMHFACKFACSSGRYIYSRIYICIFAIFELWRSVNDTETSGGLGFKGGRAARGGGVCMHTYRTVEMRSRKSLAIKNLHTFFANSQTSLQSKLQNLGSLHCVGGVVSRDLHSFSNSAFGNFREQLCHFSLSLPLLLPAISTPSASLSPALAWPNVNELCSQSE